MPELFIDDMQDGYREWVDYVRTHGTPRAPRGLPTRNVRDLTVILSDPRNALTAHIGRRASTRLAALEALQLVAGKTYPKIMTTVAPNTEQFLNVYGTFNGAYGDRVADSVDLVIRKLQEDRDTRQAVLTIFDTQRDLGTPDNKDVACTVALFFEVEDGRLNTKTAMRSNDVMWGVAHDVFMFTTLQRTIADFMGVELGEYRHNAYSSHLYDRDVEGVDQMHAPTKPATITPSLCPDGGAGATWSTVMGHARNIITDAVAYDQRLEWWAKMAKTWVK